MSDNLIHHRVAKQLLELIDSGVYLPGSKLPSERALAKELGVGRVSVRNAELSLQQQGRLEIKVGAGVYVIDTHHPLQANGLPNVGPLELTEARALFEAESAALAASIITDETIAELEKYVLIMSGKEESEMTTEDADAAFHKAIARSTNNNMIVFIINSMWKLRTENPELQKVYQHVCGEDSSHLEGEHEAILKALKNRDPHAARKAMRAHFTRMIEALLKASEEEAFETVKRQTTENRNRFLITNQIG